ncbi:DNA-binding MurR/RpiR family transcriptional regulator [Mesorhizobium sp. RMAD-H1]|nr:DNA-binding MurR/RpiR family transcriptional regulator [Mesorhizobium sp. RMAD-H1]
MNMNDGVNTGDAPKNFHSLRERILERRNLFPKRLSQVAAFALDNPDEMAFGTAASIAARAHVQPSTLVRFAQSIGYAGFSDLQAVFRERLRERPSTYDERLQALRSDASRDSSAAILGGVIAAAQYSVESVSSAIGTQAFEKAVKALAAAETIFLVAQRRSFPIASYLAYTFGKLKVRNQLVSSPFGIESEQMSFATSRDAAIAISFSPYAAPSMEHARVLSQAGVPVVSITDSAFSPLVPLSKHWFEIAEADFAGFRSLSASIAFALALAIAVGEERTRTK